MSRLLLALLLLVAPATTQDWDPCNPGGITLPPIPPCEVEESRDLDAVVLCVSAFWNQIADARVAACSGGTAAAVTRDTAIVRAVADYTGILSTLHRNFSDCVAECDGDTDCITACDAIYQVAKAHANQVYSAAIAEINATYDGALAQLELDFTASVQLAVTGFVECIAEIPCE